MEGIFLYGKRKDGKVVLPANFPRLLQGMPLEVLVKGNGKPDDQSIVFLVAPNIDPVTDFLICPDLEKADAIERVYTTRSPDRSSNYVEIFSPSSKGDVRFRYRDLKFELPMRPDGELVMKLKSYYDFFNSKSFMLPVINQ